MANFDLSKLTEGRNPQSVMLAETRELKSKWEQTGLLEGLGEREQSQISVLLENQAKQLLDEPPLRIVITKYQVGCPIQKFMDQSLFSAPHDLSQSITSFIASYCQGIHQTPFSRLI